jgi:hypothetical protein
MVPKVCGAEEKHWEDTYNTFVTFVDTFLGKQRKTWKNNIKIKAE